MEFFYKKEIDLGKENDFIIDLSKGNTVDKGRGICNIWPRAKGQQR